jgi:hypothetical protein
VSWNLEKNKRVFSKKDDKLFTKIVKQLNKNAKNRYKEKNPASAIMDITKNKE